MYYIFIFTHSFFLQLPEKVADILQCHLFSPHKVTSKDQVLKFYIVVYWWFVVLLKICFNQSEISTAQFNVFVFKGILEAKQFQTNFQKIMYCMQVMYIE